MLRLSISLNTHILKGPILLLLLAHTRKETDNPIRDSCKWPT